MREQREPRPEREHPVGKALYALSRKGWGVYFDRCIANAAPSAEDKAREKQYLLMMVEELHRTISAL